MEPPINEETVNEETDPFPELNERERRYLRHAADHHNSKAIARIEGVTSRTVDRQLAKAAKKLGANDRYDAARRFVAFEKGGGSSPLQTSSLDRIPDARLSLPVPTKRMWVNLLKVREILIWGAIIMIGSMTGLAVAAMLIHSLMLLFGANLT